MQGVLNTELFIGLDTYARLARMALAILGCGLATSLTLPRATAEARILGDVPAYLWWEGCGPTSGMMVLGYWDGSGFPQLIAGSNDWSQNEYQIRQAIASWNPLTSQFVEDRSQAPYTYRWTTVGPAGQANAAGHVEDYSVYAGIRDDPENIVYPGRPSPYPDMSSINPSGAHANNCLADFTGCSFSALRQTYGSCSDSKLVSGLEDYARWKGVSVQANYVPWNDSTFWGNYLDEIRQGNPVILDVDRMAMACQTTSLQASAMTRTLGATSALIRGAKRCNITILRRWQLVGSSA